MKSVEEVKAYEAERRLMIETQIRRRGIYDQRVLEAMFNVPRHEFLSPELHHAAYADRPLPIGASETISQPYMVAAMSAAARISPGDKALEVGTGSGYQAAILAELGARVFTIERNIRLVESSRAALARLGYSEIEVIWGDGTEGYPAAAPYDAILVTAAAPAVPQTLIDQLAEGGRLAIPVGGRQHQDLQIIFKHDGQTATRFLDPCQFVPLIGKYGWPRESDLL